MRDRSRWLHGGALHTGGLGVALFLCSMDLAQAASWVEKHPAHQPSARDGHAAAYDVTRHEVVVFGGYSGGFADDTWVWNGTDWIQRMPAAHPSARAHHSMAYDAAHAQVVLFGGANSGLSNETWTWDGVNWTQRFPPTSPSARWTGQFMAYDAGRGRVVLFGGNTPPGCPTCRSDETWTWDGTTWAQEHPLVGPPALSNLAIAYDEDRGETLLFSGIDNALSSISSSWTWDGVVWTQRSPLSSPAGRADARMAFDGVRSHVLLFGGFGYGVSGPVRPFFDDTWTWDGSDWTLQSVGAHPSDRAQHAMAYDSGRGQVLLFGGSSGNDVKLGDTWVWGGSNPVCDAAQAVPSELWPPNHKVTQVSIAGVSDPQGSSVSIAIDQVTQDEPVNGLGDGDTSPDAAIQGANVRIRAERSGTGNGRVYRIGFTANDGQGGTCTGSVPVSVPHDKKTPAIDDGQMYDSTLP